MKKKSVLIAILLMSSAFSVGVHAAVVFDNGAYGGSQVGRFNAGSWTMYEDFTLNSSSTITGVNWSQHDQPGTYTGTDLWIYNGVPSVGTIAGSFSGLATRTANALPVLFSNYSGFNYSVSGLNILLGPGTYYLGIHTNLSGGQATWDQTAGNQSTLAGRWQSSGSQHSLGNFYSAEDSVFQIVSDEVTPVPEPSSIALIAIGLIGLGLARHNRRS